MPGEVASGNEDLRVPPQNDGCVARKSTDPEREQYLPLDIGRGGPCPGATLGRFSLSQCLAGNC